ncbi:myoD family inhibitor-like isoform X1 [Acipenser ruthenus]|uniref:myoD family inhibitor-like isoform X1 n=1 Tax=Acipenser ruthenus TaxID=7906 RepID=UPI0027421292|nr:myoD family inhibitor-like isoform X1 [Acipenser ruthenus]
MSECVADIVDSGKARDAEASGPSEMDPHNGPPRAEAEPADERSLAGNEFSTNEREQLLPSTPAHKTGEDLALPQPECPPPSASYTEAPPPYVNGHSHPKGVSNGAPPICTPPQLQVPVRCLQNHRPGNGKRLTTSSYKSQHSIKCTASHMQQSAGEEVCASLFLACLSCHLSECLLISPSVCWTCTDCLCAQCCPWLLPPLLAGCRHCAGCLNDNARCCCYLTGQSGCSICEACLQTTECLEIAMEISELCFH